MAKKDDEVQADDSGKVSSTYSIRIDLLEAVWRVAFPVRDLGLKQWREMYSEDLKNLGNSMAMLNRREQAYVLRCFLEWYAKTYFSILEAVAMSRAGFMDDPHARLNVCHRGVVEAIESLLALPELEDFPGKFEAVTENVFPKSVLEKAWGSGGREQATDFVSRAGKFLSCVDEPVWYKPHGPVYELLEYCRATHRTFLIAEIVAYRKADAAAYAEAQEGPGKDTGKKNAGDGDGNKRGAKAHRDHAQDKKIYEARKDRDLPYKELAREFFKDETKTREVGLAIDSHRKRLERMGIK